MSLSDLYKRSLFCFFASILIFFRGLTGFGDDFVNWVELHASVRHKAEDWIDNCNIKRTYRKRLPFIEVFLLHFNSHMRPKMTRVMFWSKVQNSSANWKFTASKRHQKSHEKRTAKNAFFRQCLRWASYHLVSLESSTFPRYRWHRDFDNYCDSKMLYREGGVLHKAIFQQIMGRGKPKKQYNGTKLSRDKGWPIYIRIALSHKVPVQRNGKKFQFCTIFVFIIFPSACVYSRDVNW